MTVLFGFAVFQEKCAFGLTVVSGVVGGSRGSAVRLAETVELFGDW